MDTARDVAVLVGSLRKDSINRRMAQALAAMAPPSLRLDIVGIGELPHYNTDLDTDSPPAAWAAFRDRVGKADALLFVTPEYNRSVPGVLKNAIDVGSRPRGKNVFGGKPGGVVTVSPGAIGGFGANHHLRQILVPLDVPLLQQPEAYVGSGASLFDEDGGIENEGTRKFLGGFMQAYAAWVERQLA